MNNRIFQIRRSVALVSLAAALVIGGVLAWLIASSGHTVLGAGSPVTLRIAGNAAAGPVNLNEGFAPMLEPLLPAVVNISTSKVVKSQKGGGENPFFNDPFFRQFFGNRSERTPQANPTAIEFALGSGVIVNADGHIMTNHHVVDGADQITVELTDHRTYPAKLIGSDQPSDLAVLKIGARGLPMLTLGDSDKVRVGDVCLAIGYPLGIGEKIGRAHV